MELTNETLKSSNEFNKKIALIEQERDFLKNEITHLKENTQRKDLDLSDFSKQIRERDDKIKSYRQKKKQSEKDALEFKALNQKYEQQLMNMQPINNNQVDSAQVEVIRKELENMKLEKIYLQN